MVFVITNTMTNNNYCYHEITVVIGALVLSQNCIGDEGGISCLDILYYSRMPRITTNVVYILYILYKYWYT